MLRRSVIAKTALVMTLPAPAFGAVSEETGRWVAGIGDPTVFGWLTVAIYALAAAMAASNAPRAAHHGRAEQIFWGVLAAGLLLLAVNKQLDLQSWLTQVARDLARQQGWYESRRIVQIAFIAGLAICGVVVVAGIRKILAAKWRDYSLVTLGVVGLLVFVVVRAATFHNVDTVLGISLAGMSINAVIEIGSIATIVLGILKWKSLNISRI